MSTSVFSSAMLTIVPLPGEMVDILVKGHCNQGELTYFSHKMAPLSRYFE